MRFRPVRPAFSVLAQSAVLASALLVTSPVASVAHELPSSVTVFAFVKPEGRVLRVVLRVPLEAMRDIDFPLRQRGYLDIAATQPLLANAATTWIADYLTLYENGTSLAAMRVAATRISLPSDRSFTDYPSAVAHLSAPPLDSAVGHPWPHLGRFDRRSWEVAARRNPSRRFGL